VDFRETAQKGIKPDNAKRVIVKGGGVKNIMLKHCKKEYIVCLMCNKLIVKGAAYLLLQERKQIKRVVQSASIVYHKYQKNSG